MAALSTDAFESSYAVTYRIWHFLLIEYSYDTHVLGNIYISNVRETSKVVLAHILATLQVLHSL